MKRNLLSVPDFTVIKLIMCIAEQKGYHRGHFNFQNVFPNEKLDRAIYADVLMVVV